MKTLILLAFVCAVTCGAGLAQPKTSKGPISLCAKNEMALLSWATQPEGKLVSLCASKDFGKNRGYLQYRFGRPGKIELEFPKSREKTQSQFTYAHYFRARVDLTAISFVNGNSKYTLNNDYNSEEGPEIYAYNIVIEPLVGERPAIQIPCRQLAPPKLSLLGKALPNIEGPVN